MRFRSRGGCRKGDGKEGFDQPDGQPGARCSLAGSSKRRHQRGNPHSYATPTGQSGKFGRTLHRFPDVAEMIGGASVDGDGFALWSAKKRTGGRPSKIGSQGSKHVQYLIISS